MTITYLFRSSGTGHSIEGLFDSLRHEVERQVDVTIQAIRLPFVSRGIRSIWRNLRFVATLNADVFHITGDIHYAALCLPPSKTVLTIHDCVILKTNQNRPIRYALFWLLWYYLPVRRAGVVTVVSEKTRQELIHYVGAIAQKTIVVANSYDPAFVHKPAAVQKKRPVLLQIGTAPHKNLPNLIAAIEEIDCLLVVAGPLSTAVISCLNQQKIMYQHYVNLSRDEIIQLYTNCDLVTFVSTYEGFGVPILEANAIGRPVITSNISPMREVAGEAAHFVDPADVTAIRQGILRLIYDATYRQILIDAGLKNARQYTTTAIAQGYVSLYQQQYESLPQPVS